MSIRDLKSEDLPKLGSPRAAVESCVSLIAGMAGQPENVIEYWLDLYYQVRFRYEHSEFEATTSI